MTISTESRANGGWGGDVILQSHGTVLLDDEVVIDASGDTGGSGDALGANVEISACQIDIQTDVVIDVTGEDGGHIILNAGALPPDTGTQPLRIDETADLRAASAGSGRDGTIELAPVQRKPGGCDIAPSYECTLDDDCSSPSCPDNECLQANPDTDGVEGQFDLIPIYLEEAGLDACPSECP